MLCLMQAPGTSQATAPSQPTPEPTNSAAGETSSVPADSTAIELINAPEPDYPLEAAAKRVQGKVVVQLHISETGDVENTDIVSGDPVLAAAAERAMKTWKFKPFIRNGKPVRVRRQVPWEFALKGDTSNACAVVEAVMAMNLAHHRSEGSDPFGMRDSKAVEGSLIRRVEPQYPGIAKMEHIQGTVILAATIGKDGLIHNLKALCGHPVLIDASMDAIKQWRYRPYIIDGQPVDVETTITTKFHM
ncbi:MAG TPA: energy transducer TonB [Terriglobales bacterium]